MNSALHWTRSDTDEARVVFVLMIIASLTFIALGWALPASKRLYHHITATITIISALAYFAMASHSGVTWHHRRIRETHSHVPDTFKLVIREIYWARYVDWVLTTPLILVNLGLLAGVNGATLITAISANIVMILSGLFAAFGYGRTQKWVWYTIAIIAYLVVIYHVLVSNRKFVNARGSKVSKFYYAIAGYTILVWTAYPIIWAIGDGKRILSVDGEIIAYAILDVLAKGVFGAWLLFTYRSLPDSHVEANGFWTNGFSTEGRIRVGDDEEGP
jgi:bacteriorhodopsin